MSVPYVVFLSIELFNITYVKKEVSMLGISLKMFFVVTIPVLIGMIIRKISDDFILRNMKIIQRISIGLFVIVFIAIYIEEWDSIVMFITKAGTIAFICGAKGKRFEILLLSRGLPLLMPLNHK